MKFIFTALIAIALLGSLSACWLAAGAAGAAGGYIYSEERDKQDGDRD